MNNETNQEGLTGTPETVKAYTYHVSLVCENVDSGYTTIEATSIDDAWKQAVKWARDGDWWHGASTEYGYPYDQWFDDAHIQVDVELRSDDEDDDYEIIESRSDGVVFSFPEPDCIADEHDWDDDMCRDQGVTGGMCTECGIRRETLESGWPQPPDAVRYFAAPEVPACDRESIVRALENWVPDDLDELAEDVLEDNDDKAIILAVPHLREEWLGNVVGELKDLREDPPDDEDIVERVKDLLESQEAV